MSETLDRRLRDLVDGAATPITLDELDPGQTPRARRDRRDGRRPFMVGVAAALVVGLVAVALMLGDGNDSGDVPRASPTATRPGITAESRAGHDGLGPIRLGMTVQRAIRVSGVADVERHDEDCTIGLDRFPRRTALDPDESYRPLVALYANQTGRIAVIEINSPRLATDTGIRTNTSRQQLLDTYPDAEEAFTPYGTSHVTTHDASGRFLSFLVAQDVVWRYAIAANRNALVAYLDYQANSGHCHKGALLYETI